MMTVNSTNRTTRLLSLDVLRGVTIAGMILVNNPGSWEAVYAPLCHAAWNGLTLADLVFPFFVFIMGVSCYASLRKYDFRPTRPVIYKIAKRTLLLFLVGIGLGWFGMALGIYAHLRTENLPFLEHVWRSVANVEHLRIMGVMQRLAICYGAASLVGVLVKARQILYLIGGGLIGYTLLLLFGNGLTPGDTNLLGLADRYLLGDAHVFIEQGVEPEGLLSTIPAVCQTLIGFCCGKMLFELKDNRERMLNLFLIGTVLTFLGFLISYGLPINKRIWSPTFVLVTCGLCSSLLALLTWIIDVKGRKLGFRFFEAFGTNPLAIYVLAGIVAVLLGFVGVDGVSLKEWLYNLLDSFLNPDFASLVFALLLVGGCWCVAHLLYKKKIYIKL